MPRVQFPRVCCSIVAGREEEEQDAPMTKHTRIAAVRLVGQRETAASLLISALSSQHSLIACIGSWMHYSIQRPPCDGASSRLPIVQQREIKKRDD